MTELDKFYENTIYLSYSGIKKLLYSPKSFYKYYILKEKKQDQTQKSALLGKLVHCLILDPESYKTKFALFPDSLPPATVIKLLKMLDNKFAENNINPSSNLDVYEKEIFEILKEHKIYASYTYPIQKKKIFTDEARQYWIYMCIVKNNSDIINEEMLEEARQLKKIIESSEKALDFLGHGNIDDDISIENEYYCVTPEDPELGFALHGYIDNMVVNHTTKTIEINDLKTTGKSISLFPEAIDFYNYNIQAAIYKRMVQSHYPDYYIKFRFIVIDNEKQLGFFNVTDETMQQWEDLLNQKLEICSYHIKNRKFDLPSMFGDSNEIDI